jgi:hypothetical protein
MSRLSCTVVDEEFSWIAGVCVSCETRCLCWRRLAGLRETVDG